MVEKVSFSFWSSFLTLHIDPISSKAIDPNLSMIFRARPKGIASAISSWWVIENAERLITRELKVVVELEMPNVV